MNQHISPRGLILPLLAALSLSACEHIPFVDNTPDYKVTGRGKPLEVPPDLTSASTSDTYSVPGSTTYSSYNQEQTGPQPEEEKLLSSPDNVKLERAGSQRWLVVQAPPEKVWPVVREFWTDLGFAVRVENPQTGVMETEWVDPADLTKDDKGNYLEKFQGWLDKMSSLNNRQKFRTRIDKGTEDNTTEIFLSHRSVTDIPDDGKVRVRTVYGEVETGYKNEDFNKGKKKTNEANAEDLDAELLRRLMVKLGITEQQSRTVLANPVQEHRAILGKDKAGNVTLALNDQFDRAWRRVGLALDRIGFLVEDQDRSRGVFYVKYSDVTIDDAPEQKKGLLDKLKFWGNDDQNKNPEPAPAKEDKGMLDKLKFWDDNKNKAEAEKKYSIKVEHAENGSVVSVTDKNGQLVHSATANRILNMLYEQLK
ncbi:outer membrane protein assembly factor BamC [mine drainage metagenome]|uniref:Outer membrane protein assembly factor BamC n=1 Tax=mine drainage metagenome TaxID=410659 RepID=A0A1J5QTF7_9ZZZZ